MSLRFIIDKVVSYEVDSFLGKFTRIWSISYIRVLCGTLNPTSNRRKLVT